MIKINSLFLSIVLLSLIGCMSNRKVELSIEGDLKAKNVVSIQGNLPEDIKGEQYSWYLSDSPDGQWKKLPGIFTKDIALLTSYKDKYLKCDLTYSLKGDEKKSTASVVSSQPVGINGNPNTDWMRDAGYGIMVHYLKPAIVPDGGAKEWNEAVDSFDAAKFASQANEAGAGFVMFTLGQNSGFYCAPNSAYNKALGVKPGELCSTRDLPMDLINALDQYNIPLILYLPSNPPINNALVSEKFKYAYKKDSATSQFNQPILENMIREWSMRYGKGVKGWWFDGLYSWNGIRSTRMDMSLVHNISTHTLAAKAGNKQSIVTFNSGFGKIHANTPYGDYTSGEKATIDEFPTNRWVEEGVQWFLFTYLGEKWGGHGQQFQTDSLVEKAQKIVQNEGVLCLEVVTNAQGEILSNHLDQIKAVGQKLGRTL